MKTHIIRRREGETLSDYVTRWLETEREMRAQDEREDELVPEESPFGDYYVPRAKRTRSRELRASLDALEELCAGCRKPPQSCSCAEAADLDRRYQRDQMDRANLLVVDQPGQPSEI